MSAPTSTTSTTRTLPAYVLRRSVMQLALAEDLARSLVGERQRDAAAERRGVRLVAARRAERRAEAAGRAARAARAAVR